MFGNGGYPFWAGSELLGRPDITDSKINLVDASGHWLLFLLSVLRFRPG